MKNLKLSILVAVFLFFCGNNYAVQFVPVSSFFQKNENFIIKKHFSYLEKSSGSNFWLGSVRDSLPDSLRNKSKRKTMLLGIFTGSVGGHLWYLGYHKRAMKRTMDGVLAYSLIGLGILAQYTSSSLLKNFSGFLVGVGSVVLLKVLIQTAVELIGISKGKYPKEYVESKDEVPNKPQSSGTKKHKGPVQVIER